MHAHVALSPRWTTSTFADATDSAPLELLELGAHVNRCNGCRGRWFALRCAVDTVHDFVAPRFVTTLVVVAAMIGLTALAL